MSHVVLDELFNTVWFSFLLIKWYGGTYHIRLMVRIRSVNACNSLRTAESLELSGGEGERGSGEPSVNRRSCCGALIVPIMMLVTPSPSSQEQPLRRLT